MAIGNGNSVPFMSRELAQNADHKCVTSGLYGSFSQNFMFLEILLFI
jgi:hypothetical protein